MRSDAILEINLSFLSQNIENLKEKCPNNEIIFMVKADGYGHGVEAVSKVSYEFSGLNRFGVATFKEAIKLNQHLWNKKINIYIFSDLEIENDESRLAYENLSLIPVISSLKNLKIFLECEEFKNTPLVLKVNTGMNRLGFSLSEIQTVLSLLKKHNRFEIEHLMTHFACSSLNIEKVKMTKMQYEKFENVKKELRGSGINIHETSVSNSGAIEQNFGMKESHIRPGLMLYGPSSLIEDVRDKSNWNGQNISSLKAKVLHQHFVSKGDPVGYGATPVFDSGFISIISIGYGDGLSTSLQQCRIKIKDQDVHIFGRINMDMIQLFHKNKDLIKPGELISLWDYSSSSIYRLTDKSHVIPYELLCSVGPKVNRLYIN